MVGPLPSRARADRMHHLTHMLQEVKPVQPAADSGEAEVQQYMTDIYSIRRQQERLEMPKVARLPFFFPGRHHKSKEVLGSDGVELERLHMATKLRAVARDVFLLRKEREQLNATELQALENLFTHYIKEKAQQDGSDGDIRFDDYWELKERMAPKARKYFTASLWLKLRRNRKGSLDAQQLYHDMSGFACQEKTNSTLHLYDTEKLGYLTEKDLENYVYDLIPTFYALKTLNQSFFPFYVFTAVRKIMFVLDPKRTGRVPIRTLLHSKVFDELHEIGLSDEPGNPLDPEDSNKNWFSDSNVLRVYSQYLELDTDHNGMLSRAELSKYRGAGQLMQLTDMFVRRVFEEIVTFPRNEGHYSREGEMDYKTFLDFVLAMEHMNTPQALSYFWRLLDVHKVGYLTIGTINNFFRDLVDHLVTVGVDPPRVADVKDEIFDMVKPADPLRITYDDLLRCGSGATIIKILIDINGFWSYDNREQLLQQPEEDPPPESGPAGGQPPDDDDDPFS